MMGGRSTSLLRDILVAAALLSGPVQGLHYRISELWTSANFFDGFAYNNIPDPTHGAVTYVDAATARSSRLTSTDSGFVTLKVQSGAFTPRQSIRLISKSAVPIGSLIVADIYHQPGGICGTWPAFWLLGNNSASWPACGEIDILEGVNDGTTNQMTLHTNDGFYINSDPGLSQATMLKTSCASSPADNSGCGMYGGSYGASFNAQKGGMYAVEVLATGISIWFFNRGQEPRILRSNKKIDATKMRANWGKPMAHFLPGPGSNSIVQHFQPMNMIINTDLCGDWAGQVWGNSPKCRSLASTCEAYVASAPNAFDKAYWKIKSVRVYDTLPNHKYPKVRRSKKVQQRKLFFQAAAVKPEAEPSTSSNSTEAANTKLDKLASILDTSSTKRKLRSTSKASSSKSTLVENPKSDSAPKPASHKHRHHGHAHLHAHASAANQTPRASSVVHVKQHIVKTLFQTVTIHGRAAPAAEPRAAPPSPTDLGTSGAQPVVADAAAGSPVNLDESRLLVRGQARK